MEHAIRPFRTADLDAVAELSIRAWRPVFASMRATLGEEVFLRLYPSWEDDQGRAVRATCVEHAAATWVGEVDGEVAGFATVVLPEASPLGVVEMLAVDPRHQRRGLGRALTDLAVERIRAAGRTVAMIETGGDPGHLPARATYAAAGFTLMPIARFFKAV